LELIRYIHLNPLRAKLVQDLKELDKYPWTGHSAIMGKRKNPLVPKQQPNDFPFAGRRIAFSQFRPGTEKATTNPENPVDPACPVAPADGTGVKNKPLAEKTTEEVLLYFGDTLKVARRRYRQFVKQGVDQGKRPEFQGGGLVRSAGGNKEGLLGRKKEERELGDERILGSGDFVAEALQKAGESFEAQAGIRPPLEVLIDTVSRTFGVSVQQLKSRSRRRPILEARSVLARVAIRNHGYKGVEVAEALSLSSPTVSRIVENGENILDNKKELALN